jgi:signal transduction histidine kinase/CheY-like chemotaxis protein
MIVIAIVSLFANLTQHERRARDSVREDAIWAAYQLSNEAGQLQLAIDAALHHSDAAAIQALTTRFDVLYSRASFLVQGQYAVKFDGDADIAALSEQCYAAIMAMTPAFDAMVGADYVTKPDIEALVAPAETLKELGAELLIKTNTHINETRVQSRAVTETIALRLAGGVTALVLAFISIVILMAFQLTAVARGRRALELLSVQHEQARRAAEEANRAKSAFLATMSHEIRTPLNGIIGMVDMLESDETDHGKRTKLAIVRQSGDILLEVTNDILDFSRLESGGVELERTSYDLNLVMDSVRSVIIPRAQAKGLSIMVDCPPLFLLGDAARVRQVLMNLAANAVKFTDFGSVVLGACYEEAIGLVRFSVRDTGIGIAEEAQSRLFKEFSQVDSSINRRFGGSGLGLAICSRLVVAMGGTIGVESVSGAGSEFWFTIPFEQGDVVPVSGNGGAYVAPPVQRRALLVEDNTTNREVASSILENLGLDVAIAVNGAEACKALERSSFDIVFMDMQMPVMDGLEATRSIRATGNPGTVVGLTANAFVSDREACLDAGMDDFMSKPVTRRKFEAMLLKWVEAGTADPGIVEEVAPAEPSLIDNAHQLALVEEPGEQMMGELREMFWADAEGQLEALDQSVSQSNLGEIEAMLHTIKGASHTLGYVAVASAAQAAREKLSPQARLDLGELRNAMAITFSQDPPPSSCQIMDSASPIVATTALSQHQYWRAVRTQSTLRRADEMIH